MKYLLNSLLIILLSANVCFATDYYVDADNGDDANGGLSEGDAFATIQKCDDTMSGQDRCYFQKSTANYTETLLIESNAGGTGEKTRFIGYNTTPGDNPKGEDRPIIDGESTRANCINVNGNYDQFMFANFICEDTTGTGITGSSLSTGNILHNVLTRNTTGAGIAGIRIFSATFVETSGGSAGCSSCEESVYMSWFHDSSGVGLDTANSMALVFSISSGHSNDCWETGNPTKWLHNVAYGCTGGSSDGFSFNDNTAGEANIGFGNISVGNGGYGFNKESGGKFYLFDYNLASGNASGSTNNMTVENDESIDINQNPHMVDASSDNFTITSTSVAIGAINMGDWLTLSNTYTVNIGVDQSNAVFGGGGGTGTTSSGGAY